MKVLLKRGVAVRSMIKPLAMVAMLGLAVATPGYSAGAALIDQPAPDMVILIDGIPGSSPLLKDAIEITGFSHSMNLEVSQGAGGSVAEVGQVYLSPIIFTKHYDKSSVLLMAACAAGKHIPKATIYVRSQQDGKNEQILAITLEDVLITSVNLQAGHMGDEAADVSSATRGFGDGSVTVQYGKIKETVLGDGDPVSFEYDLTRVIKALTK